VRNRANAFREETIADLKAEEHKNTLQDYWRCCKPDLTILQEWKPCLHF